MSFMEGDVVGLARSRVRLPLPRADDVVRPDLVARLPSNRHGKRLTMVLGPAGWGKTTLLGQWAVSPTAPDVSFLAVDAGDNEVARFLHGLHMGLAAVAPGLPDLEREPSASSWIDYTFPTIVEELSRRGRIAICLDDYHHIQDPDVHTVVQALIDGLPDTAHVVVGSRVDPPLRLARMRASREIEEIRIVDLQFSVDDTEVLLHSAFGLQLDRPQVTTLHTRTEGWAAGIILAGITLQSSNDSASAIEALPEGDRLIFDYLSEEILAGLDSALQEFLVTMSIVDQFDVDLSGAITGREMSSSAIEELEQRNLVVSTLADQRRWYRFHTLFRSFLRRQLELRTADERAELHRLAGEWLAAHGAAEVAVPHLLAGGAWSRAAAVIVDDGHKLFITRPVVVYEWIEALPPQVLDDHPTLYLAAINSAYIAASTKEAMGWIDRYERAPVGRTEIGRYTVRAQRLWGLMMSGRWRDATRLAGDVLSAFEQLDAAELAKTSHLGDPGMAAENTGVLLAVVGEFDRAVAAFERVVERHREERWLMDHAALASYGFLAELAWLSDDLVAASSHTSRALALVADDDLSGYTLMARAMSVLLDPMEATAEQVASVLRVADRFDDPFVGALAGMAEAAYRAASGQRTEAQLIWNEVRDRLARVERSPLAQRLAEKVDPFVVDADLEPAADPGALTDRELQVLRALTGGLTQREIGRELYLSFNTIKTYSRSLYRKLGVRSRTDAVLRARALGLA